MMANREQDERLRADLASLRIERTTKARPDDTARQPQKIGPGWRLALAALLLFGLAATGWRLRQGSAVPVDIAYATVGTPGDAELPPILSGSGYIVTGERYVSIGVRVAGRIDRYFIEEGQTVRKGDSLVKLDDRDYRASVGRVEAGLKLARANSALAEAELRRGHALVKGGVISAQESDVLRNRTEVASATIAQLTAELQAANVNLDYTTLRAPSDGVVLAKLKEVGEIAVPGGFAGSGDLVRIANLADMRAELDVNEVDLERVRLGGEARVTPDAYPDRHYQARVVKLYPQVDRQKGTLKVEVKILAPDEKLLPDMSTRVTFLAAPAPPGEAAQQKSVLVPAGALQRDNAGGFVWVVLDDHVRRADVETAGDVGGSVRIVRGLSGGEAVVVGAAVLEEGQRVSTTAPG